MCIRDSGVDVGSACHAGQIRPSPKAERRSKRRFILETVVCPLLCCKDATKAVNLVVQVCRSYLIAAEHACSSCDEWEPIVHSVRDISGCEVEPADDGKSADTPTGVGT